MKVFDPNIFLIYGMPQNGKTCLAHELKNTLGSSILIHTDIIFLESQNSVLLQKYDKYHGNIYDVVTSENFDSYKFLFLFYVLEKIKNCIHEVNYVKNIIIEGFSVYSCLLEYEEFFHNLGITNIFKFDVSDKNIIYNGEKILNNDQKIENIKKIIFNPNLLQSSNYQQFDFLGDSTKASDSNKKYMLSGLDKLDINEKTILDIGCNAGYFLFRLLSKTPKMLVGIDSGLKYLKIGYDINKQYFDSNKILFLNYDIFQYNFDQKYDIITCFSTFHYFIDKQQRFIDLVYENLNINGKFILEVEESDDNSISKIDKRVREQDKSNGTPLDYPNEKKMLEMIQNKFIIESKVESVYQPGSIFKRQIYTLNKV